MLIAIETDAPVICDVYPDFSVFINTSSRSLELPLVGRRRGYMLESGCRFAVDEGELSRNVPLRGRIAAWILSGKVRLEQSDLPTLH
jgi:hypothetical protein